MLSGDNCHIELLQYNLVSLMLQDRWVRVVVTTAPLWIFRVQLELACYYSIRWLPHR
jgi:hypothetical protein